MLRDAWCARQAGEFWLLRRRLLGRAQCSFRLHLDFVTKLALFLKVFEPRKHTNEYEVRVKFVFIRGQIIAARSRLDSTSRTTHHVSPPN